MNKEDYITPAELRALLSKDGEWLIRAEAVFTAEPKAQPASASAPVSLGRASAESQQVIELREQVAVLADRVEKLERQLAAYTPAGELDIEALKSGSAAYLAEADAVSLLECAVQGAEGEEAPAAAPAGDELPEGTVLHHLAAEALEEHGLSAADKWLEEASVWAELSIIERTEWDAVAAAEEVQWEPAAELEQLAASEAAEIADELDAVSSGDETQAAEGSEEAHGGTAADGFAALAEDANKDGRAEAEAELAEAGSEDDTLQGEAEPVVYEEAGEAEAVDVWAEEAAADHGPQAEEDWVAASDEDPYDAEETGLEASDALEEAEWELEELAAGDVLEAEAALPDAGADDEVRLAEGWGFVAAADYGTPEDAAEAGTLTAEVAQADETRTEAAEEGPRSAGESDDEAAAAVEAAEHELANEPYFGLEELDDEAAAAVEAAEPELANEPYFGLEEPDDEAAAAVEAAEPELANEPYTGAEEPEDEAAAAVEAAEPELANEPYTGAEEPDDEAAEAVEAAEHELADAPHGEARAEREPVVRPYSSPTLQSEWATVSAAPLAPPPAPAEPLPAQITLAPFGSKTPIPPVKRPVPPAEPAAAALPLVRTAPPQVPAPVRAAAAPAGAAEIGYSRSERHGKQRKQKKSLFQRWFS